MDELIQANVQMSAEQYMRLTQLARKHNTSVSEIVKRAVEHYTSTPSEPTSVYDWREKMKAMQTKGEHR